jgi:hypothetical protein
MLEAAVPLTGRQEHCVKGFAGQVHRGNIDPEVYVRGKLINSIAANNFISALPVVELAQSTHQLTAAVRSTVGVSLRWGSRER